jgi:hypothetical protein|tara:strand:+ start:95 stop:310 length:216 start_codon:yes stop_codon:yes gene_type:complete
MPRKPLQALIPTLPLHQATVFLLIPGAARKKAVTESAGVSNDPEGTLSLDFDIITAIFVIIFATSFWMSPF